MGPSFCASETSFISFHLGLEWSMRATKFNFDQMMELAQKDPERFEQVRCELLLAARQRVSGPQREALDNLQKDLDEARSKQPDHFVRLCFDQISSNLEKLPPLWSKLNTKAKELHELAST